MKALLKSVMLVAVSAIVGLLLLMLVFLIPIDKIEDNVKESAEYLSNEECYVSLFNWCSSQLDNFSDSLMLLNASNESEESILNRALLVYRNEICYEGSRNPYTSLTDHYVLGKDFNETVDYSRYWHGYLVLLKPLLTITNYKYIRLLNTIVQISLIIAIYTIMVRKKMTLNAIAYLISYLLIMPLAIGCSIHYSSCFYIYNVSVLMLLCFYKKISKNIPIFFCFIGILTSYCDLMTYPIATFGMPAVVLMSLTVTESKKEKFHKIASAGVFWCIGYGGMWISKWIVAEVLTNTNAIYKALNTVSTRTSDSAGTILDSLSLNIYDFKYTQFFKIFLLFCLFIIIMSIILKRRISLYNSILYCFIGITPILWYIFALNQTCIHHWFTHKNLIVSACSIMFLLIDWYKESPGTKD